jgi:hypothetical protein
LSEVNEGNNILYLNFQTNIAYNTNIFNRYFQNICSSFYFTIIGRPVSVYVGSKFQNSSLPRVVRNPFLAEHKIFCNKAHNALTLRNILLLNSSKHDNMALEIHSRAYYALNEQYSNSTVIIRPVFANNKKVFNDKNFIINLNKVIMVKNIIANFNNIIVPSTNIYKPVCGLEVFMFNSYINISDNNYINSLISYTQKDLQVYTSETDSSELLELSSDIFEPYSIDSIKNIVSVEFFVELESFFFLNSIDIDPSLFIIFDLNSIYNNLYVKVKIARTDKSRNIDHVFKYIPYHNNIYHDYPLVLYKQYGGNFYTPELTVPVNPKRELPFYYKEGNDYILFEMAIMRNNRY